MNPPVTLGQTIRDVRVSAGISQRQLAKAIKRSNSFVSDIEADRHLPGTITLTRLAAALDLNPDFLLRLKRQRIIAKRMQEV